MGVTLHWQMPLFPPNVSSLIHAEQVDLWEVGEAAVSAVPWMDLSAAGGEP